MNDPENSDAIRDCLELAIRKKTTCRIDTSSGDRLVFIPLSFQDNENIGDYSEVFGIHVDEKRFCHSWFTMRISDIVGVVERNEGDHETPDVDFLNSQQVVHAIEWKRGVVALSTTIRPDRCRVIYPPGIFIEQFEKVGDVIIRLLGLEKRTFSELTWNRFRDSLADFVAPIHIDEFFAQSRLVLVERNKERFSITPTENCGSAVGHSQIVDTRIFAELNASADELSDIIGTAFERCE